MATYTRKAPTKGRPTPNVPIRGAELSLEPWTGGVRFGGRAVALGELGGAQKVGVNLEEIPPGKQSCPFHWHQKEEEHFYVLEGKCILRSGPERYEMGAGDYVCFPAGSGVGHCFENPFAEMCKLLCVGTRDENEIAVYPDSGKMKLRALGKIVPIADTSLDYWNGERSDEPLER